MAIIKCKMCGGDIELAPDKTFGTCEYCGSTMTLPKVSDEQRTAAFNRGNHFRRAGEFDKALAVYEHIVQEDDSDAEAHWCCALCRFGIEYVEDPTTYEWLPTCHRASFDSFLEDVDYLAALEHSDGITKRQYQKDAAKIAEVQRGILATSQNEEPFDVFICYKESDDAGNRTKDSTLAQDIYYQLTEQGHRVFFARITLEDKAGTEYEPYIFAALNSAKVMVVVGTKPEHFNAVWVKNEWSRFLAMMKKDRSKLLLPCYRDMDPYDLPEALSVLQSYDMAKIGFVQDLIRGINKITAADPAVKETVKETVVVQQGGSSGTTVDAQVKRGNMALEDGEWEKADGFFEEALNLNPECAEAYLGKLLAKRQQPNWAALVVALKNQYAAVGTEKLEACPVETAHIEQQVKAYSLEGYLDGDDIRDEYRFERRYDSSASFRELQKTRQLNELAQDKLLNRLKQYAKGQTKKQIEAGLSEICAMLDQRIAQAQEEDKTSIERVKAEYKAYIAKADQRVTELSAEAQNRQEQDYQKVLASMNEATTILDYENAINAFQDMNGYKDSEELATKCQKEIDRLNEAKRQEEERQAAILKQEAERVAKERKKIMEIAAVVAVAFIAAVIVVTKVIIPNIKYNSAVALMEKGEYEEAISAFEAMNGYKDSANQIEQCSAGITHDRLAAFANVSVGDTIIYGSYEQDNNTSNGREAIEWIVLEKEDNQILLISKYALDCQQYNTSDTDVTWSTCTLRTWMNSTFLSNAFTNAEQAYIPTVTVTADKNPEYSTSVGSDTQDQIFLLSITEVEKYFSSDSARQSEATPYVKAQGAYIRNGNCWWWLRSPGRSSEDAARVSTDGSIHCGGCSVSINIGCVRPAMWISLDQ